MNCIALTAALGQDVVSMHSKYTTQKNSLGLNVFSPHLKMLWSNLKQKKDMNQSGYAYEIQVW